MPKILIEFVVDETVSINRVSFFSRIPDIILSFTKKRSEWPGLDLLYKLLLNFKEKEAYVLNFNALLMPKFSTSIGFSKC